MLISDTEAYDVWCVVKASSDKESFARRCLLVTVLELLSRPRPGESLWRPRAGGATLC